MFREAHQKMVGSATEAHQRMSESIEEAHQIEDFEKWWGCSLRIIEHMAEAHWRTPPVHFGTSVGMVPRMGISETGFALQENPIKRLWEDPKTGAKGANDSLTQVYLVF